MTPRALDKTAMSEAGIVKDLQDLRIGQQPLQIWRVRRSNGICTASAEPSPGDN